ncbi:MAG: macro domain-containing protein [Eubacteriaceae bacterium]|nr:macro domain-containing protein [Eubacteriaceae bacterium]
MCLVRPFFFAKPSIFFCRLKGDRPAGKAALLAERKKIGDIPVGKAAVTSALRLNVQYIIYTVGPVRHGGDPDQRFAAERKERTALSEPAGDSSLSDAIGDRDISFQEYLLQLIIERDLENAEVYHRANITKQHFSKIMSNRHYHPKKNTVCALAIALHLDLETTGTLLEKAGMLLSRSSRFDLAVEYFILHKMVNIVEDNIVLDENNLALLGTR